MNNSEISQIKINESENQFPFDVFPKAIQEIITATNESLNFPVDYISSSILFAVSVAIGNTHRVELKTDWTENAVLYLVFVGSRGISKSHPLKWAIKPIQDMDNEDFIAYDKEKKLYDIQVIQSAKNNKDKLNLEEIEKPQLKQRLVQDFTPEALVDVHRYNPKGIGVYVDELGSWYKNFNRYNKGSEEQFWLSSWSGISIKINRKTGDPVNLPTPHIPVVGTIQPGLLNDLTDNRTENGFTDRLLFVMPDNLKKEYWSELELSPNISRSWSKIIKKLLDLEVFKEDTGKIQPEVLAFSLEAKKHLYEWQKSIADESNECNDEVIRGINAKIESYVIRLSLILEMMHFACGESRKKLINVASVEGAIKLTKYFKKSALKIHSIVLNENPLEKFPKNYQMLYDSLELNFTTKQGLDLAVQNGIKERTFKSFIKDKRLFERINHGYYEKLL